MEPTDPRKNGGPYANSSLHASTSDATAMHGAYPYGAPNPAAQGTYQNFYPGAQPGYGDAWGQSSSLMSQPAEANGFGDTNTPWNSMGTSQSSMSSAYQWIQPSSNYGGGGGVSNLPYQTFMPQSYASPDPYPSQSMLSQHNSFTAATNNTAFRDARAGPTQTVSPAALDYGFSAYQPDSPTKEVEDTAAALQEPDAPGDAVQPSQVLPAGVRQSPQRNVVKYGPETSHLWTANLPRGESRGRVVHKDETALKEATESEPLGGPFKHVMISKSWIPAEETRTFFPKPPPDRPSLAQMRRDIIEAQAARPWSTEQHPLLKKLGIISKAAQKRAIGTTFTMSDAPDLDTASESSSEESGDGSASEASDDDEPSPLPAKRPTDANGQFEYDVVAAAWAPSSVFLGKTDIGDRLRRLLEAARLVRDAYKSAAASMKAGEEAKIKDKMDKYRPVMASQKRKFTKLLTLVNQHGHDDVLHGIGQIGQFLAFCTAFLTEALREATYEDPLSENVFKLFLSTRIPNEIFEKLRLEKYLKQWIKRSPEKSKQLAQKVLDHLTGVKGDDASAPKEVSKKESLESDTSAGAKRPRPTDEVVSPPAKRKLPAPAPPRSGPLPVTKPTTNSAKQSATAMAASKLVSKASGPVKPGETASKPSAAAASAEAPKPKPPLTKSLGLLSGLKAAKKSSSSTDEKASTRASDGVSVKPDPKALETKPKAVPSVPLKGAPKPAPAPVPAFSFTATMANLGKPREAGDTVRKGASDHPQETPEQRKERLRKEKRRKLRVSFPPDDQLVQVRLFHHHPDEDYGHQENLIRDADDLQKEGHMLKMHKEREVDEEEEYEPPEEMGLVDWCDPSEVDFSDIPQEWSKQHVATRGGPLAVTDTPEMDRQNERERSTLIAVYPSAKDIPSSPREPLDTYAGGFTSEAAFGEPREPFVRAREPRRYTPQASAAAPVPDVASLLKILQNSQSTQSQPTQYSGYPTQTQYGQHQPQYANTSYNFAPASTAVPQASEASKPAISALNNLEAVFARFSTPKASDPTPNLASVPAAQAPSQPQIDPSILNALSIFKQQQAHSDGPSNQYQAPAASQYQPSPSTQQYGVAQPASYAQTPGALNLAALLSSLKGSNSTQSHPAQDGDDRKRQWEGDDQQQDNKRNKASKDVPPNYKTVICRFWREGTCRKGDDCTYLHD